MITGKLSQEGLLANIVCIGQIHRFDALRFYDFADSHRDYCKQNDCLLVDDYIHPNRSCFDRIVTIVRLLVIFSGQEYYLPWMDITTEDKSTVLQRRKIFDTL